MKHIHKIVFTVGSLYIGGLCHAQQSDNIAGSVTKYNAAFNGIGPKVYNLPAPRTEEEILQDEYQEKKLFQDSIARAMQLEQIQADFRFTSQRGLVERLYQPLPANSEEWNKAIHQEKSLGNTGLASALLNEYAWKSLNNQFVNQAVGLLIGAVDLDPGADNPSDMAALQRNLADAYLFNRNYREAANLHEHMLARADKRSGLSEQANSWVQIALVQAYLKDFKLAENSIIRKAIPLYNRAKDMHSKVLAWKQLAAIYQMHDKHTEAQWFLIQARDLAAGRGFNRERGEIEYMLASSKLAQKNYKVALAEFERAQEWADQDNDQLLQLAIHDKKGETYLGLSQYDKAQEELDQYWILRKKLFSTE